MKSEQTNNLTKITASLYAPMYNAFDDQLSKALLRRDAFIDRMIEIEIPHLRIDLNGKKMSPEAKRYVSSTLKQIGGIKSEKLHLVSISVRKNTAQALNDAVTAHNLDRNAFINRLIVFLRSSDGLLKSLDLPLRIADNRRDGTENMATSPLKAMEEIQSDPFYYLRSSCESQYGCGLYALPLPPKLHGLSCYIPDDDVPKTQAYKEKIKNDLDMVKALENFEASILPINTKPLIRKK
jgi:hypothetical protein